MDFINYFISDRSENTFPEKFLYHIWDEQHIKYKDYKAKVLKTISGLDVKIHFQGHFNTMSGADFKNAIVEIDKKTFTGDVEIHINTSDWYHHQHDTNPAYNSVILHVVLNHNHLMEITVNENGDKIEILELKNIISDDIEKLFKRYSENVYKIKEKYCSLFSTIRPEFYESFLLKSGLERLEKKIKRFQAELSFVSMDQLFYQSILEAMGYSKNKHQFYLFSKEHKWIGFKQVYGEKKDDYIRSMSNNKISSVKSATPIQNINNSLRDDFIKDIVSKAEFDNKKYNWYLFRIRPCNHPKTRLYQISPFIFDSFSTSMTTEIVKLFSFTEIDFSIKKFMNRLYEKFSGDLNPTSDFYHQKKESNQFTKYKLGKDRINTIVINIFIPILIIYANIMNDSSLLNLCYRIYKDFRGLEENNISQIMRKYMSEEQFIISQKKAIYQQGILNIYHKYCINNLCNMCKENMLVMINQG
ncbi:MAG: DUF2851 family protein [Candidatus Cloacimonetes bacterium]|nr:DUF2851 family protein [Candidatus Cloacimonadota bacterium]